MTLGQKLRQTRLSKGLSQSQVAGDCVTRNMLSQIENDQASPSMRTLEHLAQALGVSVGWLLSDEQTDAAMERMRRARALFRILSLAEFRTRRREIKTRLCFLDHL